MTLSAGGPTEVATVATAPAIDSRGFRKRLYLAVGIAVAGILFVAATRRLADLAALHFLDPIKDLLVVAEFIIFGATAIETAGRAIRLRYDVEADPDRLRRSVAFRAALRTVTYGALGVISVAILAKSTALAVSVGSFAGLIVGMAAQNTIGNAFAGLVISIAHPFEIGDDVEAAGASGKIAEIGAMYTRLDSDSHWVLIPNNVLLATAIRTKKRVRLPRLRRKDS